MKRRIAFILCLLILSGGIVFALDFGVTIGNDSTLTKKDDTEFDQENKFSLWLTSGLGESWKFNGALAGTLTNDDPVFYGDVERLALIGTFANLDNGPSLFTFEAGRFLQNEFSYRVFAHTVDGLRFSFAYPLSTLQIGLGYTGLINKHYSSVIMSKGDAIDDVDDDVLFAAPRLIGSFAWTFPELFARQTLSFSALIQEDLRHLKNDVLEAGLETENPAMGGSVNTQYFGVGLQGPVMQSFYYDAYFYLGTGKTLTFAADSQSSTGESYQYEQILSYLFGGSARYYLPEFFQSVASLSFLYASGDKDSASYLEGNVKGNSSLFLPIAGQTYGTAFTPKASNVLVTELSYSLKPFAALRDSLLSSIQTSAMLTPFFKPANGPMSESEVDAAQSSGYLGTEIAGAINYRPYSDLGMSLALGLFMPNKDAFVEGMGDPWFVGRFQFSFSF
jgi:hypothetical protein